MDVNHDLNEDGEQQSPPHDDDEPGIDNDTNNDTDYEQQQMLKKQKLNSILDSQDSFPLRQRNYIDDLVENFLDNLKDDIHDMITDQTVNDDHYEGLDSSRDTEAEVETALRFFPENLSRRKETIWNDKKNRWVEDEDGDKGEFPIQCLMCVREFDLIAVLNLKTLPFIQLFARLAIEFNLSFDQQDHDDADDDKRGGLLLKAKMLHEIKFAEIGMFWISLYQPESLEMDVERKRHVDNLIVTELIRWRRMGLLMKEDKQKENLVLGLLGCNGFSGRRLRFFIEWDPLSILTADRRTECTILRCVATFGSIEEFISLFDYLIRYYPMKKGICTLFQQEICRTFKSPYRALCDRFNEGREMIAFVEDTLARYSNTTPLNTREALLLAATDKKIDLSCVYFLVRRQPYILLSLYSSSKTSSDSNDRS